MLLVRISLSSSLIVACSAAIHNLFAGNLYAPASLHLLEFNDETKSLKKVQTFAADAPHSWIQFNHDKKNIYGCSLTAQRVASYEVAGPTSVKLAKSIPAGGACKDKTSAFVLPLSREPYSVLTASWPSPNSCGMSISVHANGTMKEVGDSWSYERESGVHGLALAERGDGQLLVYSADLNGDLIWTHAVDQPGGKVRELGRLKTAKPGMHPRHLVAHPNGTYLYVLMEAENTVHQVGLDGKTGVAVKDGPSYSLIPDGEQAKNYWSASVALSPSGRYLWATARGQRGTRYSGYVSCFLLAADGAVAGRMFMVPTSTAGATSNAVAPAPWSDEYAILTEATDGVVEVLRLAGKKTGGGDSGVEYATAETVAKLTIGDGGCCANAIWYN